MAYGLQQRRCISGTHGRALLHGKGYGNQFLYPSGAFDAFIFSSPSRVYKMFVSMAMDHSIFLHMGVTLAETLISFLLVFLFSLLTTPYQAETPGFRR